MNKNQIESICDFNERKMDSVWENIDLGKVCKGLNEKQKYIMGFT